MSVPTPTDADVERVRAVAQAICKSRTCEGWRCCQWPAQMTRTQCPVRDGAYDDAARAAIAAMPAPTDLQRFHDAWVEEQVASATGDPDLFRHKRIALLKAHHALLAAAPPALASEDK
jgi:hypothetical protein